mgnify:CR=1 FL=1
MEFLSDIFMSFLKGYSYFVVGYFIVINSVYLILNAISFFHIRKQLKQKDVYNLQGLFASNLYSPISILAPAFNEEATIEASIKSLLQLRYPKYEVIVINDGSKDRTMQVLIQQFKLKRVNRYVPLILDHKPIKAIYKSTIYPELIVIDKENGRKADALNAGINVCRNDLFCAIDADCVLEPEVLQNMLKTFIEDETTIAVGGIVRVANDCEINGNEITEVRFPKKFYPRIQVVEYLRAFLFGRVGWDYLDSLLIISGAFGIFNRNAVLRVGGYLHDTVGEDMELVVRLHRYHRVNKIPYRVRFLPEPVCWTEVPEDRKVLSRQRNRWQRGLADTLYRHRTMIFNPRYGRLGMFAVPFFLIFELLAPVIELFGWIVLILAIIFGAVNLQFSLVFLSAAILLGMVLSVSAILCEEFTYRRYPKIKDILYMTLFAFVENFGFRQMHMWWRLKGIWDFIKGNKEWGTMTRKGFGTAPITINTTMEPSTELKVSKEPDLPIGDKNVSVSSYLSGMESSDQVATEIPHLEKPEKFKSNMNQENPGILIKLALSLIIIGVLSLSIWPKIQHFMSFESSASGIDTVATPSDSAPEQVATVDQSDDSATQNKTSLLTWDDPSYYFISIHSFASPLASVYAGRYIVEPSPYEIPRVVSIRSGFDRDFWSAGIGKFETFWQANRWAIDQGLHAGSYEVVKKSEVSLETLINVFQFDENAQWGYDVLLGDGIKDIDEWQQWAGANRHFLRTREDGIMAIGPFRFLEEAWLMRYYIAQAVNVESSSVSEHIP